MISDQGNQLVSDLRSRWAAFQETLNGADALISRGRKHVKKNVDELVLEFHANVKSFRDCRKRSFLYYYQKPLCPKPPVPHTQ